MIQLLVNLFLQGMGRRRVLKRISHAWFHYATEVITFKWLCVCLFVLHML